MPVRTINPVLKILPIMLAATLTAPGLATAQTDLAYELYLTRVAAAEAFLQLNNISTAREYLDSCEVDRRDVEWYFLDAYLDQSRSLIFKEGSPAFADVQFSPDGRLVAAAGSDSMVTIYRYPGFEVAAELRGHNGAVTTVAFSPDGKTLASGGRDHTIIGWDVAAGRPLWTNDTSFSQGIYQVRFSPDGASLGVVTWERLRNVNPPVSGFASVLNAADGRPVRKISTEPHPESGVLFADKGKTLVVSGWAEIIRGYDLATGDSLWTYDLSSPEEYNAFNGADLSPDGETMAFGGADHRVHLLKRDGTLLRRIEPWEGHTKPVRAVAFSPDGSLLASAGDDQTIRIWELGALHDLNGLKLKHSLIGHSDAVTGLSWSPDGRDLVSSSRDGSVRLWTLSALFHQSYRVCNFGPWEAPVTSDGKRFAAACSDKKIGIYPVRRGMASSTLGEAAGRNALTADFSADDGLLATASFDGVVRLWDLKSGGETVLGRHAGRVDGVEFFNSTGSTGAGGEVVSVGDSTLRIWKRDTTKAPRVITLKTRPFRVLLSPDERIAYIGASDGTVTVFSTADWSEVGSIRADGGLLEMAVSPDGARLAVFSGKNIEIWNTESRTRERTLAGHMQPGYGIAFSPDGRYLITGSNDQTFKLWSLSTGRCTLTFHGYEDVAYTTRFISDREILVGSSSGMMHYYDFRSPTY